MELIPGINISSPSDCAELKKVLHDLTNKNRGPTYVRLTGIPGSRTVYSKDYNYKFGKFEPLTKGRKILVFSTGSVTSEALSAITELNSVGHSIKLINLHTLRPLDKNVLKEIKSFDKIVTIEEHSIIGGLNTIISDLIIKNNLKKKIISFSLSDKFSANGKYDFLLDFHNLSRKKIKRKIANFSKN